MRYLVVYVALSVGMGSCTSLSLEKSIAKKAHDNLALVDRYRQAIQSNDTTTMNRLLADGYMGYGPSVNDSVNKSQALANWQNLMATLYESVEYSRSETLLVTASTGPLKGEWVCN